MKNTIKVFVSADSDGDITVTDAGAKCIELRSLAREAILVLRSLHDVSDQEQLGLADQLERAISISPREQILDSDHAI